MDAKPRNLKDVFDSQCRYIVPLYQRPYVWTQEKQWEPLWDDIQALAERYVKRDAYRPHFMGAVVFDQLNTPTGTLNIRQIIDGQQRLTTLQIVIEAACDVCDQLGPIAANHARDLRRLARNDAREGNPDEVFKVWPTNVDREHFRRVMTAGQPEDLKKYYEEKHDDGVGYSIADGYLFFCGKIREWLNSENDQQLKDKLDAIQNALYWGLILVVIDLDEKDDAQMIFETLNARGTPLLASDLVKNFLLQKAEQYGHKLDDLYAKYWEFFDSLGFWRQMISTGRFLRPHIETFFQHYLTILTRDEVLVTNLFNTFRQYVKDHPKTDPETFLFDLNRYGQIYHWFFTFPEDTREGLFFRRIQALDTTTVFPLLLLVFDKLGGVEYEKQRHSILTCLESFLVRRMLCELSSKNYNKLFVEIVQKIIDADPNEYGTIIRSHLLSQSNDIGRWPDDKEFGTAWQTLEAYRRLKPLLRLRMVMEALELQKRISNKTEDPRLPKKKLSLEHILPRGWNKENWPLPEETEEAELSRQSLLHTIGNLTLVTGSLNSSLSNDPWSKKCATLQKYSVLLLNADLKNMATWNEDAIRQRSKDLLWLALKIWPLEA